jgi:hypothetical protein
MEDDVTSEAGAGPRRICRPIPDMAMPRFRYARMPVLLSCLLILALLFLGRSLARAEAATATGEKRVRIEHGSQPAIALVRAESRSVARKSPTPPALDLLHPQGDLSLPDPPTSFLRWHMLESGRSSSVGPGLTRPRAPPAVR